MTPNLPKFRVTLNLSLNAVYALDDFYAGDSDVVPDQPTIENILRLVMLNGGPARMITEWDLIDPDIVMDVTLIEDEQFLATTTVDFYGRELPNSRLVMAKK